MFLRRHDCICHKRCPRHCPRVCGRSFYRAVTEQCCHYHLQKKEKLNPRRADSTRYDGFSSYQTFMSRGESPVTLGKMKSLIRIFIFITLLGTVVFLKFGRPVWNPVYIKLSGGKTVAEVVNQLESENIESRFNNLSEYRGGIIIGLKSEKILELWGTTESGEEILLKKYPFTGFSGKLGPKLRKGDMQIPEGIYQIESLNPNSSYHLSIKLNYPNDFDQKQAEKESRTNLGGDIFIHGENVTIGCIPIGNPAIEEVFYFVAKVGIGNISVIISPFDMRQDDKIIDVAENPVWVAELYGNIEAVLKKIPSQREEPAAKTVVGPVNTQNPNTACP